MSNINELKQLYAAAILRDRDQFMFQGQPITTDFAEQVIKTHELQRSN